MRHTKTQHSWKSSSSSAVKKRSQHVRKIVTSPRVCFPQHSFKRPHIWTQLIAGQRKTILRAFWSSSLSPYLEHLKFELRDVLVANKTLAIVSICHCQLVGRGDVLSERCSLALFMLFLRRLQEEKSSFPEVFFFFLQIIIIIILTQLNLRKCQAKRRDHLGFPKKAANSDPFFFLHYNFKAKAQKVFEAVLLKSVVRLIFPKIIF